MIKLASRTKLFIFVSIIAAVVLSGALVWGFAGLNLSISYSGGSELKVICQEKLEADKAENVVLDLLKQKEISVYSVDRRTSGSEYQVVIKTKNKSIANEVSLAIRDSLSDIPLVEVQGFDSFASSYKTPAWVLALTIIGLGAVAAFALYLVAKRWADVIAFGIGYVAMVLASFAVLVLTRIEIGAVALAGYFIGIVIESVISALLIIRFRNAKNQAAYHEKSYQEIAGYVRRRYVIRDMIIYVVVMLGAILSVAVGATEVIYFGVALALSLMCAVFATYFVTVESKCVLEDAFAARYNAKMSVTQTVQESQKAKQQSKQKPKQERPTSTKSAAVKPNKKRKRRNKSNQNKVVV